MSKNARAHSLSIKVQNTPLDYGSFELTELDSHHFTFDGFSFVWRWLACSHDLLIACKDRRSCYCLWLMIFGYLRTVEITYIFRVTNVALAYNTLDWSKKFVPLSGVHNLCSDAGRYVTPFKGWHYGCMHKIQSFSGQSTNLLNLYNQNNSLGFVSLHNIARRLLSKLIIQVADET